MFNSSHPVRRSTRRRLPAQRTTSIEPLRSLLLTLTLAHHLTTFIQTPHHQLHNHHQLHHRVQCFIWQEVDIGFDPCESNSFPFAATPGMSAPTPSAQSFINQIINHELVDKIVLETNRYARQSIQDAKDKAAANSNQIPKYSVFNCWVPTDRKEMYKFLGLLFLMGLIHEPEIRDYRATDELYYTPIFSAIMPRNRFQAILKFFHFNNNSYTPDRNDPDRDRLYKLRLLLDHLGSLYTRICNLH